MALVNDAAAEAGSDAKVATYLDVSLLKKVDDQTFFGPVMTAGMTAYDKAKEYLHGQRSVDLPAAANYFRKSLEELISEKNLPKELFLNDDFSLIPGYKLTKRVSALADLFLKIGEDATNIMTRNVMDAI